jgi:hypothetical protein
MLDRIIAAVRGAIADILNSASGYGHVDFEVVDGELRPRQITITHQPNPGERLNAFLARLSADGAWHDGDHVEFVYNKHRLHLVRVTRSPAIEAAIEPA